MSKELSISERLNQKVASVIGAENVLGFQKAFLIAEATKELKSLLDEKYMQPIMALQGSSLGFKTDKDKSNGYSIDIVKNCLIEAVLNGVQPYNNHFNIIAGNMYITKQGFWYLLKNYQGLSYEISHDLPRINSTKTSAAVTSKISWSVDGREPKVRKIEFPIKMNSYMTADAVLGKADRKSRAWLWSALNGSEIVDGDVLDVVFTEVKKNIDPNQIALEKEYKRISDHIDNSKDITTLEQVKNLLKNKAHEDLFIAKHLELSNKR